jgi:hypothetical protein
MTKPKRHLRWASAPVRDSYRVILVTLRGRA